MEVDVTTTEGHTLRFKYFGRGGSKDVWRCENLMLKFSSGIYFEHMNRLRLAWPDESDLPYEHSFGVCFCRKDRG